ncbi:MAG: DUF2142 domain-containing protein [Nostocaceae cyanobacterium]|nr:DUF2142 domain-containing protein [Nostocaceae cyanobacterium]
MIDHKNSVKMNNKYALREIFSDLRIPENAFVILAVVFGLLFLFITPPFQVADESNHFLRAFQISELGIIATKQENQIGGFLPKSLLQTINEVSKDIRFKPQNKQKTENIFNLLNLPLASDKRIFLSFPNTSLYSPIPYLPQAFGIKLGTIFSFPPLVLMYMGRIANLLAWVCLVYLSLKIIPDFKWLFFLLSLTPMSLFQAASLSADAVTNGLSFLWISFVFNQAFNNSKKITNFHICIMFIISTLLSLCKTAYFPLMLLYFVIPKNKLGNNKKYLLTFFVLALVNIGAIIFWSDLVKDLISLKPNIAPKEQLIFIVTHPLEFTQILLNTFWKDGIENIFQFIGVLGWLDTRLPTIHSYSYLIILLLVALASQPKKLVIQGWQKYIIFMLFILNIVIIMVLLYLSWTAVGDKIIEGLQGRYLIPVATLLFVLLYRQNFLFQVDNWQKCIVGYSIFSSTITVATLLNRYY